MSSGKSLNFPHTDLLAVDSANGLASRGWIDPENPRCGVDAPVPSLLARNLSNADGPELVGITRLVVGWASLLARNLSIVDDPELVGTLDEPVMVREVFSPNFRTRPKISLNDAIGHLSGCEPVSGHQELEHELFLPVS